MAPNAIDDFIDAISRMGYRLELKQLLIHTTSLIDGSIGPARVRRGRRAARPHEDDTAIVFKRARAHFDEQSVDEVGKTGIFRARRLQRILRVGRALDRDQ